MHEAVLRGGTRKNQLPLYVAMDINVCLHCISSHHHCVFLHDTLLKLLRSLEGEEQRVRVPLAYLMGLQHRQNYSIFAVSVGKRKQRVQPVSFSLHLPLP